LALLLAGPRVTRAAGGSGDEGAAADEESETIAVGSFKVLNFDFVPKVSIGNPKIMSAEVDESTHQVTLNPKGKGTTDVLFSDKRGKPVRKISFNIINDNLSPKVLSIRQLLSDVEGITVKSLDGKIVIDGELIVPRDFDRILQVQNAYPEVLNLVTLSRISKEAIARRMQKEINDDPGGVNVTVKVVNDTFFLNGKVDSDTERKRAETIALTYLPEMISSEAQSKGVLIAPVKKSAIRDMIEIEEAPPPPPPQMVRITYYFVEISKQFLKSSLFKWAPLMSESSGLQVGPGTAGGTAASGSFSGIISSLVPKLQAGANGGFARVLFSTVAIGMDQKKIEILRQDNVPYVAAMVNGVPIPDNAQVGISVDVTPTIMG
jgi:pilus assembly protein CpaC